ncbi:MAG: hypothetical protein EOP85_08585 [Verrucomicrobiaceae bacterium]|nr:MAG: hypothetical protein EOP85_08585 [Verrucomicrobiaceae bacterium]
MTRRKTKTAAWKTAVDRARRVGKLLEAGWIQHAEEIPEDALPVDPDRFNPGGSYHRLTFYKDMPFTCRDCGKHEVWKAEDQLWYFETSGVPYYHTAVRCRPCRAKERKRKQEARRNAGHGPG